MKQHKRLIPQKSRNTAGFLVIILLVSFFLSLSIYLVKYQPQFQQDDVRKFVIVIENRARQEVSATVFFNDTVKINVTLRDGEDRTFEYFDANEITIASINSIAADKVIFPKTWGYGWELHIRYYQDGSTGYAYTED